MDTEQALAKLLKAHAGVAALVGTRIYPGGVLPQSVTYPAIAYQMVGATSILALTEVSRTREKRVRFWSATEGVGTYGNAKALDLAVRACLAGYTGTVSDGLSPASTIHIQAVLPLSSFDLYEAETQTHMVVSDYTVWTNP
jgi:hypothetical protein